MKITTEQFATLKSFALANGISCAWAGTPDDLENDFCETADTLASFRGYHKAASHTAGDGCLVAKRVQPFPGDRRRDIAVMDFGDFRAAIISW